MQVITVAGRLGGDAETRQTGSGDVTSFNIAVDQGFGDRKTSNWYRVNIWGKKGSGAARFLTKGGRVTVVGAFEIGEYNGKPQYQINASDFTLPVRAPGGGGGETREPQQRKSSANYGNSQLGGGFDADLDDDMPFADNSGFNEWRAS